MRLKKLAVGGVASVSAFMLMAGPAFAHECTNASKDNTNPGAGAQIIFGDPVHCAGQDEILYAKPHAMALLESGEFPSGWIAFDIDCDGKADAGTFIVTPNGELPEAAQFNGSPTQGIINICTYFGLPLGCFDE